MEISPTKNGVPEDNSLYWTDSLAKEIREKFPNLPHFVINDAKTPSGVIHVGSLRGVVIHDAIRRSFSEAGMDAEFFYEFDDMDAFDRVNKGLPEEFNSHLGKPFWKIPSPEPGHKSFGHCYAEKFAAIFPILGAKARLFYMSDLYLSGKMNNSIRTALDNAKRINEINERISGAKKKEDELPFQPICEKCGKIGSTFSYDWNGQTVKYKCIPKKAEWADGCGHEGEISPFDGRGKLPWKAEWAGRWPVLGVNVELAGKDHYTKTGSRAVSDVLANEVFNYPNPYGFGYEWFLVGGRKMSTSKGVGLPADEAVELIPPVLLRFLLIKTRPRAQLDFDPSGYTLIRLFDEYDKYEKSYFGAGEIPTGEVNVRRIYELSQVSRVPSRLPENVPFSHAVTLVQIFPDTDSIAKRIGLDSPELRERLEFARKWVEKGYSPEEMTFALKKERIPEETASLSEPQKNALSILADFVETGEIDGSKQVPELAGITPKEFFSAVYISLFGKEKGPRLSTLLEFLDRDFLVKRFRFVG